MSVYDLPPVNATLNAVSAVFLLLGFVCIKLRKVKLHAACMVTALVSSAVFLGCYLVYHFHARSISFTHPGPIKVIYLVMLASHVLLAIVNLPMIIITVTAAARRKFDKHRRWARWTWPIWVYVSVTGVLVYFMLYRWWPSEELKAREASRAAERAAEEGTSR